MSKSRVKPGYGKTLEQLHPKKSDEVEQNNGKKPVVEKPKAAAQWWKKPRIVQFNVGRIEFSLPYQVVIAIVLGLILLVLIAYRLGQLSMVKQDTAGPVEGTTNNAPVSPTGQTSTERTQRNELTPGRLPARQAPVSAQSTGDNVIVLTEYGARAHLVPVQQHFARYGIELEIIPEKGRYFLQTKNKYDNPATAGTNGYKARQNIIKVGAAYKGQAPEGYETFAPNYFKDAYGKKVK